MTLVRVDLNISLDGYAAGRPSDQHPMGEGWGKLTAAYASTRTFQQRVLGKDGTGTTGVDEQYAAAYFEGVGAEVMGAGMFGLHAHPDDPDWRGWWDEDPPFGCPVYVLTSTAPRDDLVMQGGTTFLFRNAPLEDVLAEAREAAGDQDVRIGGGVGVARDALRAGLVDRLHVGIAPVLLGGGESLWDGVHGLEDTHDVTSEVAESGTLHVTFTRRVRS